MSINSKNRRGLLHVDYLAATVLTGKAAILAAAVAVGTALPFSAQATQRNWKGNGADTLWNTSGNWDAQPGSSDSLQFRTANVGNRTATINGSYSYTGNIHMGLGSSAANPYVWEATDPANVLTIKDDIWFGYNEDGWLWIKSGTYVFSETGNKNFHLGQGKDRNNDHNFWLKVGDGSSTASMTIKGHVSNYKGSVLTADKATFDLSGYNYYSYNTSSAYLTNSTMKAANIYMYATSSMTLSNSTVTASGDFNICQDTGNSCTLKADSSTLRLTSSGKVFNVGIAGNSTGVVEKNGGDWDCYYLRLGMGSGATGTFTMDGGTLTVRTELGIGRGANSTGTFTLNGGTVKAKSVLVNSTATSTLVINGGTFQANGTSGAWIDSPVDIRIGANGGTFHTDGGNVVIAPAVNAVENTAGDLTVTGGGMAEFSAGGSVAGAITIGEDTGFRWFDADATVSAYTIGDLTLGAGSTLYLDADTTGCDTFNATATNLAATAEKKVTFRLIVRAMPESGRVFPLFAMSEADAANCNVVAETPAGATLILEKGWANGFLTYAIFAKDYIWNDGANGGGWTDGAKWGVDGSASEWSDNNKAVFANAGDVVTLDADVAAVALDFRANATVNVADGVSAAIATPEVIVASGVSATVNAPISGAAVKASVASGASATLNAAISGEITKEGAGTLVLGTNRTTQTTLTEGTLRMAGTASLDWTKLTFGTDPAKPVTLRIDGTATLANTSSTWSWSLGYLANITSTVVKAGGDWTVKNLFLAGAASADSTFVQEGGTLTLTSTADIGKTSNAAHAHFDIAGGTVQHSGYVHLGANCPATMTVRTGARYETTTTQANGLIVSGNADATLNVSGGDVFVDGPLNLAYYGAKGPNAVANITAGGVIACDGVKVNDNTTGGTALITIDGGTLRANKDNAAFVPDKNNLTVKVGSNGGTIDANGKNLTFFKPILEDAGSTGGGMTFTGGGLVTFTAANTYTGTTTIEVGTTVHIPAPGAIGGGLVVTVPETQPTDGIYTLLAITGEGTFPASVLTGVVAPENATLRFSQDSKAILCTYGNPGFIWIGGASGSLSDASNWANNAVPQSGDSCIIDSAAPANLTLGDTFDPAYITFPAGCGLVTISGERTLSGLSAITNNATQHHVLAFPIDASAARPTLPLLDADYLVFSGGIALTSMPSIDAMRLAGVWNLTGNWNAAPSGTSIMAGSTVNVSGTLISGYNIVIQTGATLRAAAVIENQGVENKNRILYMNNGAFIVAGGITNSIQSGNTTEYSLAGFFAKGSANSVTRANGLVHSASTKANHMFRLNNSDDSVVNTFVLGSGGLSFFDNLRSNTSCYPYFQIDSGKSVVFASSDDWSFGANPVSNRDLCLELTGSVTVDTSDYDDRTVGHTVRVIGRIGSGGSMTVKGCGRLVFEHYCDFSSGLTVQDTATVAFNAGCGFSRGGNATVNGNATLEVAQSGSLALGKNLTLADGATLAFNFTERKSAPVLNMSDKTLTANGTVKVKISAADGIRPSYGSNGKYTLTAGQKFAGKTVELAEGSPDWAKGVNVVDGEIVLNMKPSGTIIIVR